MLLICSQSLYGDVLFMFLVVLPCMQVGGCVSYRTCHLPYYADGGSVLLLNDGNCIQDLMLS
jgi:hypothetical protein